MKKPCNSEICKRLNQIFEMRHFKKREDIKKPVYAYKRGGSIRIRYLGWTSTISGEFAWKYLRWLENGNKGTHFEYYSLYWK